MKEILGEKKKAFLRGDSDRQKELEKQFRWKNKEAQIQYKDKMQEKFTTGDVRAAWDGMNTMMGRKVQKQGLKCDDPITFSNDLNSFYARFDDHDFSSEVQNVCKPLSTIPNDITVSEASVNKIFSRVNPRKASGPDGVGGKVLKECSNQLCAVFSQLFQLLLNCHFVPRAWRTSLIIPVAKTSSAKVMNDFRPVALTSIVCKCMERLVCDHLTRSVATGLDPLQFAYKAKRGVEDATLTLFDSVFRHLDKSGTFVRVLMMDFSSAFNTLQPHLLLKRLIDLDVSPSLVLWVRSFLSDRPQRVCVNGTLSNEIVLNTGAPQGCVLSPVLFSIYTNEMMCNNEILMLVKYADDMALIAKLKDEHSLSQYFDFINSLVTWFGESYLKLNVKKTKEICFEANRAGSDELLRPIQIESENVEKVDNFKYLGTVLDKDAKFRGHVDLTCKKANQRMYLIRKLKSFSVEGKVLELVYRSLVESILSFNIVTWYGNLGVRETARLNRVVNLASKLIGRKQKPLSQIYYQYAKKKAQKILSDRTHPLNESFQFLHSGRRLRVPSYNRHLYKLSFVPSAIKILNSGKLCRK